MTTPTWRKRERGVPEAPTSRLARYPRLTRFYGIMPQELVDMPHNLIDLYWDELPALQAEEQLLAMAAADYPHNTQDDRDKSWRQFKRLTGVDYEPPAIDVTNPGDVRKLAEVGIPVIFEPKAGEEVA